MQRTVIERRLVEPGNPAAGEVILSGIQREDSVAWTEIRLTFENGASQELPVPEDAGYQPRLWIGSLTGAGKRDILLSIDSGGSGAIGYYTVYAEQGDGYALVFSSDAYQPRYAITYQLAPHREQVEFFHLGGGLPDAPAQQQVELHAASSAQAHKARHVHRFEKRHHGVRRVHPQRVGGRALRRFRVYGNRLHAFFSNSSSRPF